MTKDAFLKIASQLQDAFNKTKQKESGYNVYSLDRTKIGTPEFNLMKAYTNRAKNIDEMNFYIETVHHRILGCYL